MHSGLSCEFQVAHNCSPVALLYALRIEGTQLITSAWRSPAHCHLHPPSLSRRHELLTWQLPWGTTNPWQLVNHVLAGGRLEVPPREVLPGPDTAAFARLDAYLSLMQRCWAQDPSERPAFQQIVTELRCGGCRVVGWGLFSTVGSPGIGQRGWWLWPAAACGSTSHADPASAYSEASLRRALLEQAP